MSTVAMTASPPKVYQNFNFATKNPRAWDFKMHCGILVGQIVHVWEDSKAPGSWVPAFVEGVDGALRTTRSEDWAFHYHCRFPNGLTIRIPVHEARERIREHPASRGVLKDIARQQLAMMGECKVDAVKPFPDDMRYRCKFLTEMAALRKRKRLEGGLTSDPTSTRPRGEAAGAAGSNEVSRGGTAEHSDSQGADLIAHQRPTRGDTNPPEFAGFFP